MSLCFFVTPLKYCGTTAIGVSLFTVPYIRHDAGLCELRTNDLSVLGILKILIILGPMPFFFFELLRLYVYTCTPMYVLLCIYLSTPMYISVCMMGADTPKQSNNIYNIL